MAESRRLSVAAGQLDDQGHFADARALYERALKITEDTRGPGDPQVAAVAARLAGGALPALAGQREVRGPVSAGDRHPRSEPREGTSGAGLREVPAGGRLPALGPGTTRRDTAPSGDGGGSRKALGQVQRRLRPLPDHAGEPARRGRRPRRVREDFKRALRDHRKDRRRERHPLRQPAQQSGRSSIGNERTTSAPRTSCAAPSTSASGCGAPTATTSRPRCQNLGIVARERKDYETAEAYHLRALAIRERLLGPCTRTSPSC